MVMLVVNKVTGQSTCCTDEQAAQLMELDVGDVRWAVKRTGRCDTNEHVTIPLHPEEE